MARTPMGRATWPSSTRGSRAWCGSIRRRTCPTPTSSSITTPSMASTRRRRRTRGALTVRGYDNSSPVGVRITNSHFGNGGCSDGVQIIGGAYGVQVGPGNEFSGIKQGICSNHVDSIQLYGSSHTQIVGNYFHDDDTVIMAPDGGDQETITDNVMLGSGYVSAVQLGSQDGTSFAHNTVKNIQVQTGSKVGGPASRNVVVQDNAFAQGADLNPDQGSGCSSCPTSYNLFATSAAAAAPTPGRRARLHRRRHPTSYSGYALGAGSPGKANASDGADRGIRVAGATHPHPRPRRPTPPPPTPRSPPARPARPTTTPRPSRSPRPRRTRSSSASSTPARRRLHQPEAYSAPERRLAHLQRARHRRGRQHRRLAGDAGPGRSRALRRPTISRWRPTATAPRPRAPVRP